MTRARGKPAYAPYEAQSERLPGMRTLLYPVGRNAAGSREIHFIAGGGVAMSVWRLSVLQRLSLLIRGRIFVHVEDDHPRMSVTVK